MDVLVALVFCRFSYSLAGNIRVNQWSCILRNRCSHYHLIKLGKFLEARAKGKTSEAIKKLMGLSAKQAIVLRNGEEISLPVDDVVVGDVVIVKPGEKIPGGWSCDRRYHFGG